MSSAENSVLSQDLDLEELESVYTHNLDACILVLQQCDRHASNHAKAEVAKKLQAIDLSTLPSNRKELVGAIEAATSELDFMQTRIHLGQGMIRSSQLFSFALRHESANVEHIRLDHSLNMELMNLYDERKRLHSECAKLQVESVSLQKEASEAFTKFQLAREDSVQAVEIGETDDLRNARKSLVEKLCLHESLRLIFRQLVYASGINIFDVPWVRDMLDKTDEPYASEISRRAVKVAKK